MALRKDSVNIDSQLHYFGRLLSSQFGSVFPGLSPSSLLSSFWLFPFIGVLQISAYKETGIRRSHFMGVFLFGLVVSGSGGVISRYGFASLSVIFFGLSRHYAGRVFSMLVESGYIEFKYHKGKGPASYYGWTSLGLKKWQRMEGFLSKRLSERAAVLRHMEEIGKPVRFDTL